MFQMTFDDDELMYTDFFRRRLPTNHIMFNRNYNIIIVCASAEFGETRVMRPTDDKNGRTRAAGDNRRTGDRSRV